MNRFHSAKIYRLVCDTGKEYIGSTIRPLNERLWEHKKLNNTCSSKYLINPRIELIKNFPCENRKELELEEAKYIKESNNCINYIVPRRSKQEYRNDNREKIRESDKRHYLENKEIILERNKQYRNDNKEKLNERHKQYYSENKEKISEYQTQYQLENKEQICEQKKQYRLENKEKVKEQKKQYYLKNKDKIQEKRNEKFNCECGGKYTHTSKSQHIKTKKHQDFLKGLSSEPLS